MNKDAINLMFKKHDAETGAVIEENICLSIPYTLALTDMINRGVLTPEEMLPRLCKGDYVCVLAWHITRTIGDFPTDCPIQEEIGLFLCGASIGYQYLKEIDDNVFAESLAEIVLWADDDTEDVVARLKNYPTATQLVDDCKAHITKQLDELFDGMRGRNMLYTEIAEDYYQLAEMAADMLPPLAFHKEILDDGETV